MIVRSVTFNPLPGVEIRSLLDLFGAVLLVIILDPKEMDGTGLIGIAAVVMALAASYYAVKTTRARSGSV